MQPAAVINFAYLISFEKEMYQTRLNLGTLLLVLS